MERKFLNINKVTADIDGWNEIVQQPPSGAAVTVVTLYINVVYRSMMN